MKTFYITTAIDYANGSPHLGHAYEKVLTDVVARFQRLLGHEVYFLTGLDEHGQKVQQSARKAGVEPIEICDRLAGEFKSLCADLRISNDDYIRTTETRHKAVVQTLLQKLYDKGDIYKAEYSGYYSVRQEQFVTEKEQVNGEWPEIYGEVLPVKESNYFFRLAQYQDWLIDSLKREEPRIFPNFRTRDVLEFLKEPLNDLCISRPKERLSWGIELPFDTDFVTYVWFDALVNYISAIGYGTDAFERHWPVDYHVIGKDILVPPHAVYWPIMLKACDIALPKALLVHGWWLKAGSKMSKSSGGAENPLDWISLFGADAFRYFVTREMNVGQDSEFSSELFLRRYNDDLGNDLGNLVSRLLNMTHRYRDGKLALPTVVEEPESALHKLWQETAPAVVEDYKGFQFHKGLERTFNFIRAINRYAEQRAPWKLAKDNSADSQALLDTCLTNMAEGLRLAVTLLVPVMPDTGERVQALLGGDFADDWQAQLEWTNAVVGKELGAKTILFPRPEAASTQA
jgi:methionyl-tRNA synthetase